MLIRGRMTEKKKDKLSEEEKEKLRERYLEVFHLWRSYPPSVAHRKAVECLENRWGKDKAQEFIKDINPAWIVFQKKIEDKGVSFCEDCKRKSRDNFLEIKAKLVSSGRS